jgi:hypothetical protein
MRKRRRPRARRNRFVRTSEAWKAAIRPPGRAVVLWAVIGHVACNAVSAVRGDMARRLLQRFGATACGLRPTGPPCRLRYAARSAVQYGELFRPDGF